MIFAARFAVTSRRTIVGDRLRTFILCAAVACILAVELTGITLDDLRADPDLSPKRLMSCVSRFKFELHGEVQPPEVFLARERGDCDDFATFAAMILREKGYTPRLIAVRMPGLTHVVCYVSEVGSYLDYNNRIYMRSLVKAKSEIPDIAAKVAKSFESDWTSASEFVYTNQVKVLVKTIAHAESFSVADNTSARTNKTVVRPLNISF